MKGVYILRPWTQRVSILVFVELALDERLQANRGRERVIVSILVFVELALDVDHQPIHPFRESEFQSLFSWNLLLMGRYWLVTNICI